MNKLKEKLKRGELVVKASPRFRSAGLIEFIGALGFDAVFLDCERCFIPIDAAEDLARAARVAGYSAVVRPEENQRHLIIRYLDCGADGIMVPHVNTADDARRIVEAASYGRFRGPWIGTKEYKGAGTITWGIEDKLIIAQIESPLAIKNLPEILKVEGIDLYYIGYNDLAQEMGFPGQYEHPEVMKARTYATKTILDAGKHVGTNATYENIQDMINMGNRYLLMPITSLMVYGAAHFRKLVDETGVNWSR